MTLTPRRCPQLLLKLPPPLHRAAGRIFLRRALLLDAEGRGHLARAR